MPDFEQRLCPFCGDVAGAIVVIVEKGESTIGVHHDGRPDCRVEFDGNALTEWPTLQRLAERKHANP